MCEILTIKHNAERLRFSEQAIESALAYNDDGAGYLLLEKAGPDVWDLKRLETYPINEELEGLKTFYLDKIKAERKEEERAKKEAKEKKRVKVGGGIKTMALFGFGESGHITEVTTDFPDDDEINLEIEIEKHKDWRKNYGGEYDGYGGYGGYNVYTKKETDESKAKDEAEADILEYKDAVVDDLLTVQDNITPGQILLMHFRLATSGKNGANTQPVEAGNYVVIHNGVFSLMGTETESDTMVFAKKINARTAKAKKLTPKSEKHIITRELKEVMGSYSIFIYSKTTKRLYYYKNDRAGFSWYDKNLTLGATSSARFPNNYINGSDKIIK